MAELPISTRKVTSLWVFSQWYPLNNVDYNGIFVQDQLRALQILHPYNITVFSGKPFKLKIKGPFSLWRGLCSFYAKLKAVRPEFREDGLTVIIFPYLISGKTIPIWLHWLSYRLSYCWIMAQTYFSTLPQPELLHAHTSYLDGSLAQWLSKRFKIPYLLTEHTGPFSLLLKHPLMKQVVHQTLKNASRVLAVSPHLAQDILLQMNWSTLPQLKILPNGVDSSLFYLEPSAFTGETDPPTDALPIRIVAISSLDENKDPRTLLEVVKHLRQRNIQFTLDWIGQGHMDSVLQQWIQNEGLEAQVTLLNSLPRATLAKHLQQRCDLLIHTSRYESFGLAILESLACGKPVVCTQCGGPESILTEPFLGSLCPIGDVESLSQAVIDWASHPNRIRLQKRRSQWALSRFSIEKLASELNGLYQELKMQTQKTESR
ncbi:MAG: glycosyltransferase [Candidatus Melainabacteria bacterium]|nr:glycosyltransferase [Candidatus Melainabacteria bacterium]